MQLQSIFSKQNLKSVTLLIVLLGIVLALSGCGLWEGSPFQEENIVTPSPSYSEPSDKSGTTEN